jgi:type II secretory pathway pseudopilin PulG
MESRLFKKKNGDKGLTIAELLVATGLLGMVLVTVMTLFAQLLHNTNKNSLLSAGAFFADTVLDQQISQAQQSLSLAADNADPAFPAALVEGEDSLATNDEELQTKYIYRLEAERMDSGVSTDPGQMWFVEIEVRWWSDDVDGSAMRAGMGNLSVKRGRLVYLTGPQPGP